MKKQRARDMLCEQLAEQVRERDHKKAVAAHKENVREAREMQTLLDKGLDYWGMPLQPGATPLKLPERMRPYLNNSNAPSPSAPPAMLHRPPSAREEQDGDYHAYEKGPVTYGQDEEDEEDGGDAPNHDHMIITRTTTTQERKQVVRAHGSCRS